MTNYDSSISINGRPISNLRYADDIHLMAGNTEKHQDLATRVERNSSAHRMEVSTAKSKRMVNSITRMAKTAISMGGNLLEDVDHFRYLGSILKKDGTSTQEIKTRIAQEIAAMTRLHSILQNKNSCLQVKIRLYRFLVISIFRYGCENWTTIAETETRIQAFENTWDLLPTTKDQ